MKSISSQSSSAGRRISGGTSRALVISRQLREISQRTHNALAVASPTGFQVQPQVAEQRRRRGMLPGMVLGFVVVVLIPAIISAVYFFLIAADQYATEIRFSVRGGETSILESVGSNLSMTATIQQAQDSMIVADYVDGRDIVEDLEKSVGLRKIYSRSNADYLSRFDPNGSIEKLVKFWQSSSDISIDTMSGIITVVVRAFTPEDALAIAKGIISSSENLVNRLSDRSRRDALRQAKTELDRTEAYLREKTQAMRMVRDADRVIDATKMAETLTTMISQLRLELMRVEQEYAVQRRSMDESSPQMQVSQARLKSMREQIQGLEAQLTGDGSMSRLSASMSAFDRALLDRTIAEQQYAAAAAAYDRARVELESQQVYLATFVQPVLPQDALYPRRLLLWSSVVVGSLLLWGTGIGIAFFVRNHFAD